MIDYIIALGALIISGFYLKKIIKVVSAPVLLIYIIIIYNAIIKFIIGNVGMPSMLNYASDFFMVIIFICYMYYKKPILKSKVDTTIDRSMMILFAVFIAITLISYVINLYSPIMYIWGFRNTLRFVIFGMFCASFLRKKDVFFILDILFVFFIYNIFVVSYQFFFMDIPFGAAGDYISGLYASGLERGGNASLDWLICIVFAYVLIQYLNKQAGIFKLLIVIAGSLYMTTLSELKIFYLQLLILLLVAILICKKSFRITAVVLGSGIIVPIAINTLYVLYPEFADFFSIETMLEYVTRDSGYSSEGGTGIDRFTVFSYSFDYFLIEPLSRVFGVGLGNADYSANFSFLTSEFYIKYGGTAYQWFSSSMVLIETGIAGIISYLIMILNSARVSLKIKAKSIHDKMLKDLSVIIVILSVLMFFYNQSLRLEASAYMIFLLLAIPFIMKKDKTDEIKYKEVKPLVKFKLR